MTIVYIAIQLQLNYHVTIKLPFNCNNICSTVRLPSYCTCDITINNSQFIIIYDITITKCRMILPIMSDISTGIIL